MSEAVQPLFLQQLAQVADVAGGQAQCVQFGQFGVGRDPGQAGLQSGEGFTQNSHASSFSGICCVSLRLL